jgi:hypothetical protein
MLNYQFRRRTTLDQLANIALALALAWASGIRLYAALFLAGMAGHFHWFEWHAPESLAVLSHPLVLGATGFLLLIEFFADKIPAIDTLWDAIHTFIRIPAGALLAAGVIGVGDEPAWTLAIGLLGGAISAGTHLMKAGSRAALNTSPEPISNWTASLSEDTAVLTGLWLAIAHPIVFLICLSLFVLLTIWLLPKLYRLICAVGARLRQRFSSGAATVVRASRLPGAR